MDPFQAGIGHHLNIPHAVFWQGERRLKIRGLAPRLGCLNLKLTPLELSQYLLGY